MQIRISMDGKDNNTGEIFFTIKSEEKKVGDFKHLLCIKIRGNWS